MRIGIDLDGVCYDFEGASRFLLEQRFGITVPRPSGHWTFMRDWLVANGHGEKPWHWLWTGGVKAGLFRHGNVLKGAVRAVNTLAKNHEIIVVTSRPRVATTDTLMWLGFHNFPVDEYHIVDRAPKSSVLCDVYVDDSHSNAVDLVWNTGGTVLLWDRPWNQEAEYDPELAPSHGSRWDRVTEWEHVLAVVDADGALL